MAKTRKNVWLNDDGKTFRTSKILTVAPSLDNKGKIIEKTILPSFMQSAINLEALLDSDKAQFSQLIFQDESLTALSDKEFFPAKKTAIKDQSNIFYNQLTAYSGNLIEQLINIDPEAIKRSVFSKARNAKFADFKLPKVGNNATDNQKAFSNFYNTVVDKKRAIFAFDEKVDEIGSDAYIAKRLNNYDTSMLRTVNMATGGNPNDSTKIVRIFKDDLVQRALGTISEIGIGTYMNQNMACAKNLRDNYEMESEIQNENYETTRAKLELTGTQEEIENLGKIKIKMDLKLSEKYQFAGTDANSLFKGFVSKAKDSVEKYSKMVAYQATQAQS